MGEIDIEIFLNRCGGIERYKFWEEFKRIFFKLYEVNVEKFKGSWFIKRGGEN